MKFLLVRLYWYKLNSMSTCLSSNHFQQNKTFQHSPVHWLWNQRLHGSRKSLVSLSILVWIRHFTSFFLFLLHNFFHNHFNLKSEIECPTNLSKICNGKHVIDILVARDWCRQWGVDISTTLQFPQDVKWKTIFSWKTELTALCQTHKDVAVYSITYELMFIPIFEFLQFNRSKYATTTISIFLASISSPPK